MKKLIGEMDMDGLRNGDVIIFKAKEGSLLSQCIALLTGSTVSHSAMLYGENQLVEMTGHGIAVNNFVVDNEGAETIHLLRLKEEPDPTPLLKAADGYLAEGIKYDYPSLLILAGYIIYHKVRPTPRLEAIANTIIGIACLALDRLLNDILHKGEEVKVMMCSQMVYQCYLDCGEEYWIDVIKNTLQSTDDGSILLADLIGSRESHSAVCGDQDSKNITMDLDKEQLTQELYEALRESKEVESSTLLTGSQLDKLTSAAEKFLDLLNKILEKLEADIPIPALFVTPADLYEHTSNLICYNTININRV